jgi:hypothetical protein
MVNIINIILVLILMLLNVQYYVLSEESKLLKETIFELKEQNQHLIMEVNQLSETTQNAKISSNYTSYALSSILFMGGIILITGLVIYCYGSYFDFDSTFNSLKASKIINQTSSEYSSNLMNQLHSQNASQISWMDKKFDAIIHMIQKANVFNNQWFIENILPLLENPIQLNNAMSTTINVSSTGGLNNIDSTNIVNSIVPSKLIETNNVNFFEKENTCNLINSVNQNNLNNQSALSDLMKAMEQTLETAKWT